MVLAVVAIICLLRHPKHINRFQWLVLLNLLAAPTAAALTERSHSLRSVLMGLYLLALSLYGIVALLDMRSAYWRQIALSISIMVFLIETGFFLNRYFRRYPAISIRAFESYDFPEMLERAITMTPNRVVISDRGNQPYAQLAFYCQTVGNRENVLLEVAQPVAERNTCILYFASDQTIVDEVRYQLTYSSDSGYSLLKCFGEQK